LKPRIDEPSNQAADIQWSATPRILVVDDDIINRDLSRRLLETAGCAIDVASDGEAAVEKMTLEEYDLVLMVSY
jgi:osomolarity two-component system response regulator SKN7